MGDVGKVMVKSNNREDDDWKADNDFIYLRESNNSKHICFNRLWFYSK